MRTVACSECSLLSLRALLCPVCVPSRCCSFFPSLPAQITASLPSLNFKEGSFRILLLQRVPVTSPVYAFHCVRGSAGEGGGGAKRPIGRLGKRRQGIWHSLASLITII